jgi:hypothetical protein
LEKQTIAAEKALGQVITASETSNHIGGGIFLIISGGKRCFLSMEQKVLSKGLGNQRLSGKDIPGRKEAYPQKYCNLR